MSNFHHMTVVCALALAALTGLPAAQAQAPTPGNILVTGSTGSASYVREYTPAGTLVRQLSVPYPGTSSTEAEALRDVVVDGAGNICVYHGTFSPYLSVYSPNTHAWTQMTLAGWSTANNGTFGGLAASGTSVFATDDATANDGDASGLIRFNTATGGAVRFASGTDYISVSLGKDGLLYALSGSGSPSGTKIDVFNPATLAPVRSLAVPGAVIDGTQYATRSIAVDAQGDILLNGLYGPVYRLAPDGTVLGSSDYGHTSYMDNLDVSADGQVLLTQFDGTLFLTDETFATFRTLNTFGYYFADSFATFVPAASTPGPSWTAVGVSTGADGFTRLLWDKSDGTATVWKVDSSGSLSSQQQYGPYVGWTAKALTTGKDNQTRLLWTNTGGAAAYYLLDANNAFVSQQQYGPYTGWTARGIAVGLDNKTRALWTNTDGTATVWTLDAHNVYASQQQYGPYQGWTAKSLTVNPDGGERLLWTNTDGTATFWHLSAQSQLIDQHQYGPYAGYTATSIVAAPDGTGRVVWLGSDAHIALWTLDAANAYTGQTQYGPYNGFSFQAISVGSDGNARLLWDNVTGQSALWSLIPSGSFANNTQYGPY